MLFFFVQAASSVASKAASGCVAAVGWVSKLYMGSDVSGTTISPFMTSQQLRILAALCTCAAHVPQLEPLSVSMFSFERSITMFLALGGSLASKEYHYDKYNENFSMKRGLGREGLSKHRMTELRNTESVKDEKARERRKELTQGVTESVKDKTRGSSQDPWVYDSVIKRI